MEMRLERHTGGEKRRREGFQRAKDEKHVCVSPSSTVQGNGLGFGSITMSSELNVPLSRSQSESR